jgi:hypothetical protein
MRFDLDHRVPARTVQRAIEQRVAVEQRETEQSFDLVGHGQRGGRTAQLLQCGGGEQQRETIPDLDRAVGAEQGFEISRAMRDEPVGIDRDKRAETLDPAKLVDRFAIAIGKIDVLRIHYAASRARLSATIALKWEKVACAACKAASSTAMECGRSSAGSRLRQ